MRPAHNIRVPTLLQNLFAYLFIIFLTVPLPFPLNTPSLFETEPQRRGSPETAQAPSEGHAQAAGRRCLGRGLRRRRETQAIALGAGAAGLGGAHRWGQA